jgi:hypothetical protein
VSTGSFFLADAFLVRGVVGSSGSVGGLGPSGSCALWWGSRAAMLRVILGGGMVLALPRGIAAAVNIIYH